MKFKNAALFILCKLKFRQKINCHIWRKRSEWYGKRGGGYGNRWEWLDYKWGFSDMKKARNFGHQIQKKAWHCIFAMVEYFHIKRTCASTHVAIEYSTRGNGFQQKSAKLVLFTGKMPCKWPKRMWFLFELNKNCAFLMQSSRF